MSLQTILEEIKKTSVYANEDVENGPVQTLSGRRGRKNQATEALKGLIRDYKKELLRSAVFIITSGENREQFATMAEKQFSCLSTNSNTFFDDLAGRIPTSMYVGKNGVNNLFDILGRHLEDKMGELDILAYNQLVFKATYAQTIKNKAEFTALIRDAISEQLGGEIVGIQAIESLATKAIEKKHINPVTPIVLTVDNEKLAFTLMTDLNRISSRVFVVNAGKTSENLTKVEGSLNIEEVNKKTLEATLTTIKKTLRK